MRAIPLVAVAILACFQTPARAQFGMEMGWGGFGINFAPSPTNLINQQSMIRAQRGIQGPKNNSVYAGNPNSYINRVRDNGFVPHYDVRRRRPPSARADASTSLGNGPGAGSQPAAEEPQPPLKPVLPLESFYSAQGKLIWPADSPTEGEFAVKRSLADQASLTVLNQVQQGGTAMLSSVTDARQKLLDYGRPALQDIRTHTTPRIGDVFHLYLLSLYESLEQATIPPAPDPTTQPAR